MIKVLNLVKKSVTLTELLLITIALTMFLAVITAMGTHANNGATVAEEPTWDETEEAYLIANLAELNWIRNDLSADYVLVDDIDASETANWHDEKGWNPIGEVDMAAEIFTPFEGTLDGQGHVIEDLFIDRSDEGFVGFFGVIGETAEVTNIGLENVDITGGEDYAGALVGGNSGGFITNSYTTGKVTGDNIVGGLVGGNGGGTITNSYTTVAVSAISNAGGFIGRQDDGTVTNSYATGGVTRLDDNATNLGSFAGELDHRPGTIEYSYSTGSVYYDNDDNPTDKGFVAATLELEEEPEFTSNFFDSEVSNQTEGFGAEAKETDEMHDVATFLDADWDIIETGAANPTEGYPFLAWQVDDEATWYIVDEEALEDEYELTINIVGNGTTDPAAGTHTYDTATEVEITANPAEDGAFIEWTGDVTASEDVITVTMDEDKSITANFTTDDDIGLPIIIGTIVLLGIAGLVILRVRQ